MPPGSVRLLVPLVPVAFALGACGSSEASGAADASMRFLTMVQSDPAAACELLAPSTRKQVEDDGDGDCAKGLSSSGLPPADSSGKSAAETTEVAGHTAWVALPEQSVFLSLFDDGWRVIAAGCTKASDDPAVPYECLVEGN